jgi:hypothetical protein
MAPITSRWPTRADLAWLIEAQGKPRPDRSIAVEKLAPLAQGFSVERVH